MFFARRHRLLTVLFALVSFLFMQMAVAGYACPGSSASANAAAMTNMAKAGNPCTESMLLNMDDVQPNLCQAHCQTGHQSADKYDIPSLPTAALLGSMLAYTVEIPVFSGAPLQTPHLMRTTAPPLTIRNCCFRI